MQEKKTRLVITFYTTAAVMATEHICKEAGIPGRIIPVPRSLTSDCGMAWCMAPEDRNRLEQAWADCRPDAEGFHIMEL